MEIRPLEWRNDHLLMLDQRFLPQREDWVALRTWQEVAAAIRDMIVRGAPAIGVAAAYGMVLASRDDQFAEGAIGLAASRPTAVNLFWAINRITALSERSPESVLAEARKIEAEDAAMNDRIGEFGSELVPEGAGVLTICNTGSLATIGIGTALGIIRTAFEKGKVREVFACETRPRLQGLRLTAWELSKSEIPFRMIPDSAAAALMAQGKIDVVVAGADRITQNGDSANKIGTYSLACLAKVHEIPFVIAAPSSTVDVGMATGADIPIEEREATEVTHIEGTAIAPAGIQVWNPAFDVTPAHLISAIVTEAGVFRYPFDFRQ